MKIIKKRKQWKHNNWYGIQIKLKKASVEVEVGVCDTCSAILIERPTAPSKDRNRNRNMNQFLGVVYLVTINETSYSVVQFNL